jgi:pimeloyl-ACP methyl ester carboxylesterase
MATHDEKTDISVDNDIISGTFVTPGTLIPGVLFVHGWGGSQEQYLARAREVAALGCICLAFDLRGHAQTRDRYFETVTREDNLRDLLAAYDKLVARRHVDPAAIAVIGSSYGGYLASIMTSMRSLKWLGLRAPALYSDAGWSSPKLQLHKDQDLKGYRRSFIPAGDNRALRACQAFQGDVLLIESEFDTIVPRTVLTSYREACKQARSLTYRCIDGADHGLTEAADQRAYTALLVGWMSEMLQGARAGKKAPMREEVVEPAVVAPEAPPGAV